MSTSDVIRLEGTVERVNSNETYEVSLSNGHRLTGFLSLELKKLKIGIEQGKKIVLDLTPYDLSKGRIIEVQEG